jgi:hypothetical protein
MTESLYKKAPTWLYNMEGESELFETQEAVDAAWENGWFGPPWVAQRADLLSTMDFPSKAAVSRAVEADPRYDDLMLETKGKQIKDLMSELVEYEMEHGLLGQLVEED